MVTNNRIEFEKFFIFNEILIVILSLSSQSFPFYVHISDFWRNYPLLYMGYLRTNSVNTDTYRKISFDYIVPLRKSK